MPDERKAEERRFALRLPAQLYEEVQAAAEQDTRSINAEIIVLLREALAARKSPNKESD